MNNNQNNEGILEEYKSLPYYPKLNEKAKELRKAKNLSEVLFWNEVKNGKIFKLDFHRQKIIGNYIVDFYCPQLELIIEIDGKSHDTKGVYDYEREKYLKSLNLEVIRFRDEEIRNNLDRVIDNFYLYCEERLKG